MFLELDRHGSETFVQGVAPCFKVGAPIFYFSRSSRRWLPGVVLGYNEGFAGDGTLGRPAWWSYRLDVQPQAPPSQVRSRFDTDVPAGTQCQTASWAPVRVMRPSLESPPPLRKSSSAASLPAARSCFTSPRSSFAPSPVVSAAHTPSKPQVVGKGLAVHPAASASPFGSPSCAGPPPPASSSMWAAPTANLFSRLGTPAVGGSGTSLRQQVRSLSPVCFRDAGRASSRPTPFTGRGRVSRHVTPAACIERHPDISDKEGSKDELPLCGMTLEDLHGVVSDLRHFEGMTVRDAVGSIFKPDTAGSGCSFATLRSGGRLQHSTVFVSHAWDARLCDVVSIIAASGLQGPFWMYATSANLHESRPPALVGRVLSQVQTIVCILTESCNAFTRLRCLFEISTAVRLELEVRIAGRQRRFGLGNADELLLNSCREPIRASAAVCGGDALALRQAVEAADAVDVAVESARCAALMRGRGMLVGGGWKDTEVARSYEVAIDTVKGRWLRMAQDDAFVDSSRSQTPDGINSRIRWPAGTLASARKSACPLRPCSQKAPASSDFAVAVTSGVSTPHALAANGILGTPRVSARQHWTNRIAL